MPQNVLKISQLNSPGQIIALKPNSQQSDRNLYIHFPSQKILCGILTKILDRDYQKAYEIAKWRQQTEYPIVRIHHFRVQSQVRDGCQIVVFLEHCPIVLQEIGLIEISQALYLMKNVLSAMEKLCQKFGCFALTEKMIAITRNHQCKIWINQNLESHEKMIQVSGETQMIKILVEIVRNKLKSDENSEYLMNKILNSTACFIGAQNVISSFAFEQNIVIPPLLFPNKIHKNPNQAIFEGLKIPKSHKRSSSMFNLSPQAKKENFFELKCSQQLRTKTRRPKRMGSLYTKRILLKETMTTSNQITMAESSEFRGTKWSIQNTPKKKPNQICTSFLKFNSPAESNEDLVIESKNRLSIMSTFNMKINADPLNRSKNDDTLLLEQFQPTKNRSISPYRHKSLKEPISNLQYILHENFRRNQWTNKISRLFSSEKNLDLSFKDRQDQVPIINDFKLEKLGEFGRFISQSLLQLDQLEEESKISNISNGSQG